MEQREIKYSIIVPVYNVEEYLPECLESLVHQTYAAYEIILVDDGSTDNSGVICDSYAREYSYIKVFHKKNGGLSDARNYGISKTTGEYMIFVDSDDYIDLNTLSIYYQVCIDNDYPDILIDESHYTFYGTELKRTNYYNYKTFGKQNGEQALATLASGELLIEAWGKCYKIDFWKKNEVHFTDGIFAEDLDLTYKVIYLAETVVMTPVTYYYREKRQGSLMNSLSKKSFKDIFAIISRWEEFFNRHNIADSTRNNLRFYFGEIIVFFIMGNLYLLERKDRKQICEELRKYIWICEKYNRLLGKITCFSLKIIGIKATCFLLFYAKRICLCFGIK